MNFDFSSLNFETIDSNINAYPDMYLNQSGVTFSKKALEDLGYPAYVLCLLDGKAKVFAIRMCKSSEPKGFKFFQAAGRTEGRCDDFQQESSGTAPRRHGRGLGSGQAVPRSRFLGC